MWAEEFYLPFISRLGGARCAAWAAVAVMPEKRETRNSSWSGGDVSSWAENGARSPLSR